MSSPFVEAYCRKHPQLVAASLSGAPQAEVRTLFDALPADIIADVLAHADSQLLSLVLPVLSDATVADVLSRSPHVSALEMLAHLPTKRHSAILAADTGEGQIVRSLLARLAKHNLSALADPHVISVEKGTLGHVAVERLCSASQDTNATEPPIYVVTSAGTLLGRLPVHRLLQPANANRPVEELMVSAEGLTDRISLDAALSARAWETATVLPVLNVSGKLLGTVTRAQLIRRMRTGDAVNDSIENLVRELSSYYLITCMSLVDLLFGVKRQ